MYTNDVRFNTATMPQQLMNMLSQSMAGQVNETLNNDMRVWKSLVSTTEAQLCQSHTSAGCKKTYVQGESVLHTHRGFIYGGVCVCVCVCVSVSVTGDSMSKRLHFYGMSE